MTHTLSLAEVWVCSCGRWFSDDTEARKHIGEPPYDPAQSQWRPSQP